MTVPQEIKLARHALDLDDDGHDTLTGGSPLTVKDEGSALATAATSIDFVGAGVTATGTGAAKTVTIPGGAPTEAQVRDAGRWEVLMIDGLSSPPEPMELEDGTDWVYGWITGP